MPAAKSLLLVAIASVSAAMPALAEDCSAKVKAAFDKQREGKSYRVSMTQPTAEGPVEMTVDYILPDRMLQTVVAPHMPGEQQTLLVGNRAFSGSGGGFEELLPHFTQSVVSEFKSAVDPANQKFDNFECAGKATVDGKEYDAYRLLDKAAKDPDNALSRTIYVDGATGLPAYNVVATKATAANPAMKASYTYPKDLVIEAPEGAPVQRRPQ
jgi:hypothetical protein